MSDQDRELEEDLRTWTTALLVPTTDDRRQQFRAGWAFGRAATDHRQKHILDPSHGDESGWDWRQGFDYGHLRR